MVRAPRRLAAAALLVVVAHGVGRAQVFRSSTDVVHVYVTVQDNSGRLVPNLSRDAFTVLDNGRPADIAVFDNTPQPIAVAMMLDMSGSVGAQYLRIRDAARAFVDAMIEGDRARIGTFGDEVAISPVFTGDKQVLERVIAQEVWPGGGTPLWLAMDLAMTSLAGQEGRRVVLTLTDGSDGSPLGSPRNQNGIAKRATAESVMFYAIGLAGSGLSGAIKALADDTGGGRFVVERHEDLRGTFVRVADELRHQYVLGITPTVFDGKLHTLNVRLNRPELRVRARKQYLARRQS